VIQHHEQCSGNLLACLQHVGGNILDTSPQGDLLLTADDSGKVRGGMLRQKK
jgi:hypothetical protein